MLIYCPTEVLLALHPNYGRGFRPNVEKTLVLMRLTSKTGIFLFYYSGLMSEFGFTKIPTFLSANLDFSVFSQNPDNVQN